MELTSHAARRLEHISMIEGSGNTPAAMFEMHEIPSPSRPMCRAAIASEPLTYRQRRRQSHAGNESQPAFRN